MRSDLEDRRHSETREQQPGRAPENGEHEALDQQLSEHTRSTGAHRHAHRDLFASDRCARQEQVGDVRTGDEEHEPDRAKEHHQRPPGSSDQLLVQRHEAQRLVIVERIRVRLCDPRADDFELRSRPFERRVRLEPADDVHQRNLPTALGRQAHRLIHVDVRRAKPRPAEPGKLEPKVCRQDADHGRLPAIQRDGAADDVGTSGEPLRGERLREEHDVAFVGAR